MAFYLILVRTSIVQKEVVDSQLWLKIKKKFTFAHLMNPGN